MPDDKNKNLFVLDHRHAPKAAEVARRRVRRVRAPALATAEICTGGEAWCAANQMARLHTSRRHLLTTATPSRRGCTLRRDQPPCTRMSSVASGLCDHGRSSHRRLAAAAASRVPLKWKAIVSAKAVPRRCAHRPKRSAALSTAIASSVHCHSELVSLTAPLVHLGCASP